MIYQAGNTTDATAGNGREADAQIASSSEPPAAAIVEVTPECDTSSSKPKQVYGKACDVLDAAINVLDLDDLHDSEVEQLESKVDSMMEAIGLGSSVTNTLDSRKSVVGEAAIIDDCDTKELLDLASLSDGGSIAIEPFEPEIFRLSPAGYIPVDTTNTGAITQITVNYTEKITADLNTAAGGGANFGDTDVDAIRAIPYPSHKEEVQYCIHTVSPSQCCQLWLFFSICRQITKTGNTDLLEVDAWTFITHSNFEIIFLF